MNQRGQDPEKHGITFVFLKYNAEIFRYFYLRTGLREISQDLTSDVFVNYLKSTHNYDSNKSSPRTWLYIIAKNILINYYRSENYRKVVSLEDEEIEDKFQNNERQLYLDHLYKKLNLLSEMERNAFIFKYVNCLSISEIAIIIKKSKSNTKVILHRAMKKLKRIINE